MVILQIRSRLVTAAVFYVFLVWAATCYPYLNRYALLIALSALLGLLFFAVVFIYVSISRDPILIIAVPPTTLRAISILTSISRPSR